MLRSRNIFLFCILLFAAFPVVLQAQAWKVYPYTPDGSLISFPVDEGWHSEEEIEWWYIAGHLEGTTSGTPYSFMLTYFYYPVDTLGFSLDGFRIFNVSNDLTGDFQSETMVLNYMDLASDHLHIDARLLNFVNEYWVHKEESDGTLIPFEYELSATAGANAISLQAVSQKAPLIPGGDGLFNQGADSYTYYYSLTESLIEGSITFEGSSEGVTGTAWIDRQYGTFNPNTGEKYEWFFLQLSNGMDLNIWNIFTPENQLPDEAAYRHLSVYVDEETQYTTHDFELERLAWAKMPASGNFYAQSWRLYSEINQLDLSFSTLHNNSEVRLPFDFFEGASTASGTVNGIPVTGIGFSELVKIYDEPILKITRPIKYWNENYPLQWEVENPDDGRPLLFDLTYSADQGITWIPIAMDLSDTLYYWNSHPFENGDSCLFRVEGYTADESLRAGSTSSSHRLYDDQYTHSKPVVKHDFLIYPNPVLNTLRIKWNSGSSATSAELSYRIVDFTGRRMMQGSTSTGEVDVSGLKNGVYLILILTEEGYLKKKFVKN